MTIEREATAATLRDDLLLIAFCLVLFGSTLFTLRPLTADEHAFARAPSADAQSDALKQRWFYHPPLPRWAIERLPGAGQSDRFVVERVLSIVCGTLVVLLTVWMSARWFGRTTSLMSGYVLATNWRFFYAGSRATGATALLITLAMFLFARCEWFNDQRSYATRTNPFGSRAWTMVGFFVLIGLSNFDGPLLIEPIIILSALAAFLVWNLDGRRFLRYAWVWGWLAMIGVGIVWPIVAALRYPAVVEMWKADLWGSPRAPIWYYVVAFILCTLPWTPVLIAGMRETYLRATIPGTPGRLVLCWAIVPLIVLTVISRKELGYVLPLLPAWAIIFAFGLQRVWKLLKARFPDADGQIAFRNMVLLVGIFEIALQFFLK